LGFVALVYESVVGESVVLLVVESFVAVVVGSVVLADVESVVLGEVVLRVSGLESELEEYVRVPGVTARVAMTYLFGQGNIRRMHPTMAPAKSARQAPVPAGALHGCRMLDQVYLV
jgi:hypothetical protein